MANTLAYYDTATITAVKSFIVQAPGHFSGAMTFDTTTFSIMTHNDEVMLKSVKF